MQITRLSILLLFVFAACGSDTTQIENRVAARADSSQTQASNKEFIEFARATQPQRLVVSTGVALVRARADIQAPVIVQYQKGDTLHFAQRISATTTQMKLEGVDYDEAWILVRLPQRAEEFGWVYGGSLRWIDATEQEIQRLTTERRIRSVLGEYWVEHLREYRLLLGAERQTAAQFRQLWQQSGSIADSLAARINELTTQQLRRNDSLPDFFWLNALTDNSLLLHWMADESRYYFWRDLRAWRLLAQRSTEDTADDDFVNLYLSAFAQDSIEFRSPDYIILLDSVQVHSLGDGMMTRLLDSVELYAERSPLFREEYQAFRLRLVDDLVNRSSHFWYNRQQCSAELAALLARPYAFALQRAERIALQTLAEDLAQKRRALVFAVGEFGLGGEEGSID